MSCAFQQPPARALSTLADARSHCSSPGPIEGAAGQGKMVSSYMTRSRFIRLRLCLLPRTYSTRSISTTSCLSSGQAAQPSPRSSASTSPESYKLDSKWLSATKKRLGKCLQFGLQPEQVRAAGDILKEVTRDWRELVAGSEGFLTGEDRRGLFRHNVVWGEMDVMLTVLIKGHVNNVMYVRYAETARVNWTRNFATYHDPAHKKQWLELIGSTGIGLILKSIKIDYKFPMTYPDKICVYHKLVHAPPSPSSPNPNAYPGLIFDVLILSEAKQRAAARCHEDVVLYDYRVGRKVSELPNYMIDQFRHTWELQQEAKRVNRHKIQEIEMKLRTLEKASRDRA
ncbi:uncharacterized protein CIMG_00604 [Coccidioides immitis RS]|uniref:Thioesterase n=1 Tax=Coccidioides immitis (strain RS) TaxID=246410 RepID=A0A0E1RZY2_COCIM|nr:uncharacterized protein CIMG_00604 [Coccidioides immitis RS]EAS35250.2 hypothetical protein CIMG_00604 [Coccidioides immitis RS]